MSLQDESRTDNKKLIRSALALWYFATTTAQKLNGTLRCWILPFGKKNKLEKSSLFQFFRVKTYLKTLLSFMIAHKSHNYSLLSWDNQHIHWNKKRYHTMEVLEKEHNSKRNNFRKFIYTIFQEKLVQSDRSAEVQ